MLPKFSLRLTTCANLPAQMLRCCTSRSTKNAYIKQEYGLKALMYGIDKNGLMTDWDYVCLELL